ncbi:hypothetical protein [Enterobacter kobei]|uniref:hypothetical protein n=1 Tax=Enterobacter kobei TaxID=208224 RepID=UPI0032AF9163
MLPSFIIALEGPPRGGGANAVARCISEHTGVVEETRGYLLLSIAEVIHLIRSRCEVTPAFITTETRIFSGLGFCVQDIEELFQEAEWRFGVRFPADENALRELFSLRPHEYLFPPLQSLPLSHAWLLCRLQDAPFPAQADISVGDFYKGLTALCLKGGKM